MVYPPEYCLTSQCGGIKLGLLGQVIGVGVEIDGHEHGLINCLRRLPCPLKTIGATFIDQLV